MKPRQKPTPILEVIKEHFGYGNSFNSDDLSNHTNINYKVLQMNLKKYANIEVLGQLSRGYYYLRTEEEIRQKRMKTNEMIDKYDLKQKKYKI